MTTEEFAQGLLERCEEKIKQNRQPIVTLDELAGMLRSLLGIAEREVARPKAIPQQFRPDVPAGTYLPGVGTWTGEGSTACPCDVNNLLLPEEKVNDGSHSPSE